MKSKQKKPNSIDYQMFKAIEVLGHGAVFVPTDFLSLGSRQAIDIALHRLVRKGTIRRLARGIYDFPEEHPKLGKLQPSPEKIAEVLVGRDCTCIQVTGAYAANILGLSEQVPRSVVALEIERTFWEKATILHAEYHRPLDKPMRDRFSRHYADTAALSNYSEAIKVIDHHDLRDRVVSWKNLFFRDSWANCDQAKPGTFRLVPRAERLPKLRRDYQLMRDMYLTELPIRPRTSYHRIYKV